MAVAIRGLQVEIDLCADREKSLVAKKHAARERMSRLAEGRAEYSNLVSSVQNHTRLVEAARKNLADARARQAGAHSASVISRIDGVEAGVRPIGPARKTVAAAGGVGGLLLGFGCIFLFANSQPVPVAEPTSGPSLTDFIGVPPSRRSDQSLHDAAALEPVGVASSVSPATPVRNRPRTASESFGMFRGISLQDAVHAVQQRSQLK